MQLHNENVFAHNAKTILILDLRTLLIVLIATSLLLAVSLLVAVGPRFRDGLGKWTGAMLLLAVVFTLYAARSFWPDVATIVVANALFVTCLTLQAAALREFHGKTMSRWWHVLPMLIVAASLALVLDKFQVRLIMGGAILGGGMLALAIMVQRLNPEARGAARLLLLTGYLIGATTMVARAVVSLVEPDAVPNFLTPTPFQGVTFLFGFAVLLLTSVGFLLLHKERSEEAAQK